MNVPRNETGKAPCKLQCSAIRLNGNKAIACVNVRTISIENYETRKIEQLEIFARTKVSFFLQLVGQKKRISVFFTAGLTKVFSRWLDKRRKGNCFWRKKPCYSGLLTPSFHSWNIPKRSHLPNIHEYPKWCCFGNLVRAMPDMHCLVANGDLASLHVLISKFFSS